MQDIDIKLTYSDLLNLGSRGSSHYDNQAAQLAQEELYKAKRLLDNPMTQLELFESIYIGDRLGKVSHWLNIRDNLWYRDRSAEPKDGVTLARLLGDFERRFGAQIKASQATVNRFMARLVEDAPSFDPIKVYLEGLPGHDPEQFPEATKLAEVLFGATEALDQVLLERWLVGAVQRVLAPGSAMHGVLLLQGRQGLGKTEFFRILAGGEPYYRVLGSHISGAEKVRMLQGVWIAERGEISSTFRKQAIEDLKADITASTDVYRPLYQDLAVEQPRRYVYGASDNASEVLVDPTGNRRFWVISMKSRLDRQWLMDNRDKVWSYALHLYRSGYSCHLSAEDMAALSERSAEFTQENPWLDKLTEALSKPEVGQAAVISSQDLKKLVGLDDPRYSNRQHFSQVKQAMEGLGWVYGKHRADGKQFKGFKLAQ